MGAKRIQVSDDAGATWSTLPGATGEKRTELANVNDTVFGQNFGSQQPSIGNWTVTGNAFFKGVAGYKAKVRLGGAPVVMTADPTTLVSGKTYQLNNAAHRVISYLDTLTVLDNGIDRTANVASVDYLNGTVTFAAAYAVVGPVTITGKYVPTTVIAKSRSFSLTQNAAEIDTTDYDTADVNGGWRTYDYGLRGVSMDIGGIHDVAVDMFAALTARSLLYMDVSPDNSPDTMFRGFFKLMSHGQSGDVGAVEDATRTLQLWVPDGALVERPFSWYFTNTTQLNPAVRKVLAAWQNGTALQVRYLPDGTNGKAGSVIVTDCSLANTYEGQNEFRFTFRGTGVQTAVP
jgi:hypothetical protein